MSCKWMLYGALTLVIALSIAVPAPAQYESDFSSLPHRTPPLQRVQLPPWNTLPPSIAQTPFVPSSPQADAPYAYRPSEMPSINPFANVRSRQQTSVSYESAWDRSVAPYELATQSNGTLPTSAGTSQQIITSAPAYGSFYDQPVQTHSPHVDAGFAPKSIGIPNKFGSRIRTGWYGGAAGLYMNRDRENNLWLSVDQTDIRDRVLNSKDADFSYAGGAGANIGHYFNCGCNSIELVYWGIYPGIAEANAFGADTALGIDTILHFDALQYDAGLGAGAQDLSGAFFFDAERHRVQRDYDVHNIELNLWGHNFTNCCGPMQLGWTAGVRYLRFDENFLYSSDPVDTDFTGDAREVHYGIDAENNLIGFQVGGRASYCVGSHLDLYADTKVGIYGNHMSHQSRIFGANGQAFVGDAASPYFGQDVQITSDKDDFAMIGELLVGANWRINSCWSINAGYRAVAVNGVALSTNQVPVDFIAALDSVREIDSNGCLILHGGFLGANYCY